jgi:hypothetical protein
VLRPTRDNAIQERAPLPCSCLGLLVLLCAFLRHDLSHTWRPLSKSPLSCLHDPSPGIIGIGGPGSVWRGSARRWSAAWVYHAAEAKLLRQHPELRLSLLSVLIGRESPGAVRRGDPPEPPCRSAGPVPARRLCCGLDRGPMIGSPRPGNSCKSGAAGNSAWPGPKPRKWPSFKPRSTLHCTRGARDRPRSTGEVSVSWAVCRQLPKQKQGPAHLHATRRRSAIKGELTLRGCKNIMARWSDGREDENGKNLVKTLAI